MYECKWCEVYYLLIDYERYGTANEYCMLNNIASRSLSHLLITFHYTRQRDITRELIELKHDRVKLRELLVGSLTLLKQGIIATETQVLHSINLLYV